MPHAHTASPSEKIRWCGLHTVAKNVQMYLQLLLLSLLELLSQPCLWRRLRQTSCSRHPRERYKEQGGWRLTGKFDMDRTKMITDS